MTRLSAWVSRLQLWPALFSAWEATAKPLARTAWLTTSGALPVAYWVSQEAPWLRASLPLKPM